VYCHPETPHSAFWYCSIKQSVKHSSKKAFQHADAKKILFECKAHCKAAILGE
jgi:hypothetical protein